MTPSLPSAGQVLISFALSLSLSLYPSVSPLGKKSEWNNSFSFHCLWLFDSQLLSRRRVLKKSKESVILPCISWKLILSLFLYLLKLSCIYTIEILHLQIYKITCAFEFSIFSITWLVWKYSHWRRNGKPLSYPADKRRQENKKCIVWEAKKEVSFVFKNSNFKSWVLLYHMYSLRHF